MSRTRRVNSVSTIAPACGGGHWTGGPASDAAAVSEYDLNRQRWATREQLRLAIVIWIEKTYHRRRRQDALGRMTPVEFETLTQAAHAA